MTKPAIRIIQKFGGIRATARALNIPATTVQGWKARGFIPASRQREVLDAAHKADLEITADDFFGEAA